jgi:4-carboxymuconolactone decarboxylase
MIYSKALILALFAILTCSSEDIYAQNEEVERKTLTAQQISIIQIACFTAKGELNNLKHALNQGLDSGLTVNEIKEVIVHTYAYCGFPRSIRGLQTFLEVLDERKAKSIEDNWGKEASTIDDSRDKYDRGVEVLEELVQTKLTGPRPAYQQFSPEMDIFLKEHLFADIFERDVLTYADRELVTISVLSSIGGVEPMLRSHLSICLNVGLTPGQLNEFVAVIKTTVGKKEGKDAQEVLDVVLKNR